MNPRTTTGRRITRRAALGAGIASTAAAALASDALPAAAGKTAKISLQSFDKIPPQKFPWGWIRWLMNAELDPDAEMTLGIVHIEPNQSNPLHVHPNSAEYVHVLSGSSEHWMADRWVTLRPGDTLRIPKGAAHRGADEGPGVSRDRRLRHRQAPDGAGGGIVVMYPAHSVCRFSPAAHGVCRIQLDYRTSTSYHTVLCCGPSCSTVLPSRCRDRDGVAAVARLVQRDRTSRGRRRPAA